MREDRQRGKREPRCNAVPKSSSLLKSAWPANAYCERESASPMLWVPDSGWWGKPKLLMTMARWQGLVTGLGVCSEAILNLQNQIWQSKRFTNRKRTGCHDGLLSLRWMNVTSRKNCSPGSRGRGWWRFPLARCGAEAPGLARYAGNRTPHKRLFSPEVQS